MGTDYSTMSDDDLIAAGERANLEMDRDELAALARELFTRFLNRTDR